ncbi:hypothetical protein ES708_34401 [subsurface metagenome]
MSLLLEILKDSDYGLKLFGEFEVKELEKRIIEKEK